MNFRRLGRYSLYLALIGTILACAVFIAFYMKISPQLPAMETLRDVHLQEPLRIYTADGKLLAEYGEKRRTPVSIEQVPQGLIDAFLAAEDDRFFSHAGVDYPGLLRAVFELVRTGEKRSGGSTITMQVARNYFLTREKTYLRKLTEIILAYKIEHAFSKQEILELYLNKIYLGYRAYGVEAAAGVYYDKGINELTIPQMAMIAALPKAPSRVNPVRNPDAALNRRNYILKRMLKLGSIDQATYEVAHSAPVSAVLHAVRAEVRVPYVAEMVRDEIVRRFGDRAYNSGFEVVTTIDSTLQQYANQALQDALLAYSHRHGYRGPEAQGKVEISGENQQDETTWSKVLVDYPPSGPLLAGLVIGLEEKSAQIYTVQQGRVTLEWEGLSWARSYISVNRKGKKPDAAADILTVGDVVRIRVADDGHWLLSQVPAVQGALVSLRPVDGAIQSLVGGFDYYRSKFNRVTQARRQPGSSFKPIVYSAALEKGFTAATLINDAPVVFDDPALESTWRPENYSGRVHGPTRLREALYRSRNLVSIRILRSIGAGYAADYAERFGFKADELPHDLTLALGSATITPLQMARAYTVLANGGYLVKPYFIQRIQAADGEVLFQARPQVVCGHCPEVLEDLDGRERVQNLAPQTLTPQNYWLMNSMMRDVVQRGTARKARSLGRVDLAGKTGTTNDQKDAWFSGFNGSLVAITWVGFDKLAPLGRAETGSKAALPMWIDYMGQALKGVRQVLPEQPEGMVSVRIDPANGLLATSGQEGAIFETFREDFVPQQTSGGGLSGVTGFGEALF